MRPSTRPQRPPEPQGDARTGGQVRADTLAARITGRDPTDTDADAPPLRVNLVIGIESLFGDGTEPGLIPGLGFLPAALCTDLVRRASAAAKATLRRLFASPEQRALVAMESTSRHFDGLLAEFLTSATAAPAAPPAATPPSGTTTTSTRAADGGTTTAANGQGLCERCNYLKETPGWTTWTPHPSPDRLHEVHGVTEHLRILRSTAPPLPGGPAGGWDYSPCELQLASNYTLIS